MQNSTRCSLTWNLLGIQLQHSPNINTKLYSLIDNICFTERGLHSKRRYVCPLSVWLRKPINLEDPEQHFLCPCAKLIITPYIFLSQYILAYRSFLTWRSWILEYGFIFEIPFIQLCFHQHYNINIETFISTHVCLVPVTFSVHSR